MKHGANIYKYSSTLKCQPNEIIDFSSNINLYQPRADLQISTEMIVKYADSSYKTLKKSISKRYEIKKSQMALYNGATSAIFELLSSLPQKDVCLYAPLYGEYEKACKQHHKKIIKINRLKDSKLKPKKGSIVIFVNPSTPEGKYYKLDVLLKEWKKRNITVILDESFLEFEDLKSYRQEINTYKNLYIIQSFSKFHSCAGVRIGAIFSHKKNIKILNTPLWNLSSFDVEFLGQRLLDRDFETQSKTIHKQQKEELFNILKNSDLFTKIYKSDSNFFLCKSRLAPLIFKKLLEEKILVRTCDSFDFLGKKHLRFAVKDKISHEKLKKALDEIS
ncbi:aminotransferase class I/II-fold pyridoxal phosphate-dependent enzyme [Sulfurimonas sp. MAG313]|nr:aminotransferase class I/II-fold pyridoxal phosphate-dependent enzyme [Sulfurimonas sp. MAG313]MDF1882166.1 aminotransferase class I/II-fold pyridoxal phosphate-dependent enzyme [Sulfurimonas sp. MAG313]